MWEGEAPAEPAGRGVRGRARLLPSRQGEARMGGRGYCRAGRARRMWEGEATAEPAGRGACGRARLLPSRQGEARMGGRGSCRADRARRRRPDGGTSSEQGGTRDEAEGAFRARHSLLAAR
jgi:hypothetical protein